MPLAELNAIHWAWLAVEYHARKHDTTGRAPLEHWLAEAEHLRPLPRHHRVDEVFLHREHRTVRRDGTVRLHGGFYEVRAEIPPGSRVELRFDPSQPEVAPRVFEDGRFVCDTVPLDRLRNASRRRRRDLDPGDVPPDPTGLDPLGLIQDEYYRRTRTPRSGKTHQED